MRPVLLLLACVLSLSAQAEELVLSPVEVAPGLFAVIGDLGPPTYENDGLNANLGFMVTRDGVVVIDTGPSVRAARALHGAIRRITAQPLRLVVNTNGQGNRWLGNAYFAGLGVPIVAHANAVALMNDGGEAQLREARRLLREKADGTGLALPTERIDGDRTLTVGGLVIELRHPGRAHTAGDLVVWLPASRVAYSGDVVYTERLPALIEAGHSRSWIAAFDALAALQPARLVPGHGGPAGMERARRDTRDYLVFLRGEVRSMLDQGVSMQDAVVRIDQSRFRALANFALLARRNAQQVYAEMEFE